jgi:hypothetical protein
MLCFFSIYALCKSILFRSTCGNTKLAYASRCTVKLLSRPSPRLSTPKIVQTSRRLPVLVEQSRRYGRALHWLGIITMSKPIFVPRTLPLLERRLRD